jgi:aminoglycoside phosphotransferase (APT) family kinase protein
MNPTLIDLKFVQEIVSDQFPQWRDLPITPVPQSGWDNRTFRLGDQMLIRMPSAEKYASQVETEHKWLPFLTPHLPLPIPVPLVIGEPGFGYPWNWSVYRWLEGESVATGHISNYSELALSLANFLRALQSIDAQKGPKSGPQNFFRGGSLLHYDQETRKAIQILESKIDSKSALKLWETALSSSWEKPGVWVHGDISAGNLLCKSGRLSAVIDFGQLCVGDPACDLSVAWTLFEGTSRAAFESALNLDSDTWERARGWTLWKSAIVAAGLAQSNAVEALKPLQIIQDLIDSFS